MVVGLAVCLGYALSEFSADPNVQGPCPTRGPTALEIGFLAGSLAFMILHDVLYIAMMKISTMDDVLRWKRRHRHAEVLLSVLPFTYILELGLIVFGIVVLAQNPCSPPSIVWIVLLSALVLLLVDIAFAFGYAYFIYFHFSPGDKREATWYKKRLYGVGWAFNTITCGLFGNLESPNGYGDDAWIQFGNIFHTFLHDMMKDLVPSDIVAAILLLRAEQKRLQEETLRELAGRALSMSDPGNSPFMLNDQKKTYALSSGGAGDEYSNPSGRMQTYLWSSEAAKKVKLKAQLMSSSTPISPRGSWISNLIASEGRVANPARRLEAFQALEMFADYSWYQEAIYGWKLFIYSTPLRFLLSFKWLNMSWLTSKSKSEGHAPNHSSLPRPNLRSQIEGRVFTHVAGLGDHHVIYASFTAYLGESVPYTICVDHDREAVVVALRGTLSFADLVTDLMITPTELEFAGRQWGFDGKGKFVHAGMFQVANRIRYDIAKQQILDKLFDHSGAEDALASGPVAVVDMFESEAFVTNAQLKQTDVSRYKLMVVGHSLGAGVAAILSLLLRPKFPKVKCLAYEPPGCVFDRELAEASKEWVTSIVCGVDVVPRLSWQNAKLFRSQLFEMLRRSKASKPKIMSTLFRNVPHDELLYDTGAVPQDQERSDLARMIQKLSLEEESPMDKIPMYLPGRVLHLAKQSTEIHGCLRRKDRKYTPMWVDDPSDFNEITISQWLLWDHFPNNDGRMIRKTLKEALAAEGRVSFGGVQLMDSINPKLEV